MKKTVVLLFVLAFAVSTAYAETVKQAAGNTGSFWQREGERSGLKESTSSWGKFWTNANPAKFFKEQQEAYDARKGGAQK